MLFFYFRKGVGGGRISASSLEDNVKKAAIWTRRIILFWYTTISESYKFWSSTCRCHTKQHHRVIQTFNEEISWESNKGVIRCFKRGKLHKIYQYIVFSIYLTRLFNLFCYMDLKSGDSLIFFYRGENLWNFEIFNHFKKFYTRCHGICELSRCPMKNQIETYMITYWCWGLYITKWRNLAVIFVINEKLEMIH